jgi:hypothetical protein
MFSYSKDKQLEGKGRGGEGREGIGREGKGKEGKGREGKGREEKRNLPQIFVSEFELCLVKIRLII